MIDTQLGQSIQDCICEECKAKVIIETQKLTKLDLLRPNKIANRFVKLLCPECYQSVIKRLKK